MGKTAILFFALLVLASCQAMKPNGKSVTSTSTERHLTNVTQLTSEGDNGEAYFSWDGKRIIFQSSRGGYACDKIWTMNIDGEDLHMVSPDHGAHTCSFFFPDGHIVFASTSRIPGACPPRPETPKGACHLRG